MLANKGNLHWKFLQEHRPFHVSQQGSSAFIPGLLLFLSLFLCPQSILSGSYSSACPQCLSPIQHQNPLRNVSVATISQFWYPPSWHLEFNKGAFFKAFSLKKNPTLKTLRLTLLSYWSVMEALPWWAPWNLLPAPEQEPSRITALGEKNNGSGWKNQTFPPSDEAIWTNLRKDTQCCLSNPSIFLSGLLLYSTNAVIMGKII